MKNIILKHLFCIIAFFIFISCAYAEETTTAVDTTCNYNSQAYLGKEASYVEASYAFNDNDGETSFDISIYNLTEDINATITWEEPTDFISTTKKSIDVTYYDTDRGTYTFTSLDTENVINYTISISSFKFGCTKELRRIKVVKPKYNKYSDYDVCKYEQVKDYYYCQKWITKDFVGTEDDIVRKIKEKRKSMQSTTTFNNNAAIAEQELEVKNINRIKMYIIIGLSIGIVADIIIIIILIKRIKNMAIYD